ncbi:hypothetical protein [Micromonospora lutea]|uniref:Uncharacterized protein n=1 Tax=Micromonospora lutea TaxID=419825 RepID=A0ABQ4IWY4_9ACTN|nr:hypothetical protein [Micromonospora lutea]GIJ22423.1 hypothetical protein Vlu01_30470 [Micromonospora lutea]
MLSMYNLHLPVQLSPDHGLFDRAFYRVLPDGLRDAAYAMPSLYPASWADSPGPPTWWSGLRR